MKNIFFSHENFFSLAALMKETKKKKIIISKNKIPYFFFH